MATISCDCGHIKTDIRKSLDTSLWGTPMAASDGDLYAIRKRVCYVCHACSSIHFESKEELEMFDFLQVAQALGTEAWFRMTYLTEFSVPELRTICRYWGIKGYSKLNKQGIIDKIVKRFRLG